MQKYPDLSNPRFLEPKDNLNQWLFSLDLLYISKGFNFNPDFRTDFRFPSYSNSTNQ